MSKKKKVLLSIVGVLALVLTVFIVATWAPDRPVESLKAKWAQPPSTFVSIQGMNVHLRDEGPRDDQMPIILLHGTSSSLHTWDGWTNALRDKHRVIRLDLPGYGLTGPHSRGRYDAQTYASFMQAVLDHLMIRDCVIGGNSFGAYVAWKTASADSRVRKLILVDSAGYPNPDAKMPIGFKFAKTPVLNQVVKYLLPRSVIEKSLRSVYGDPNKVTPELIDIYYDLAVREGNRTALVQRFEQTNYDSFDEIARIKIPTLILWGKLDHLIAPQFGDRFHHDIAGSKLVVFDTLGHVPHEEDPVATVAPTIAFLEGR